MNGPDAHLIRQALQKALTTQASDPHGAQLLRQLASYIEHAHQHRLMHERRRETLTATLRQLIDAHLGRPGVRDAIDEDCVIFDAWLCINALERDEPVAWITGGLRPGARFGSVSAHQQREGDAVERAE